MFESTDKKWKFIRIAVICIFITATISLVTLYALKGGRWKANELDLTVLDDTNPVRRKARIEQATILTAKISDFDNRDENAVHLEITDYPNVVCTAYLCKKDICKLNIGDIVTLRGRTKYEYNDDLAIHDIRIGQPRNNDDIFTCYAVIVEAG